MTPLLPAHIALASSDQTPLVYTGLLQKQCVLLHDACVLCCRHARRSTATWRTIS
jgi:hypothetical protein